MCVAKLFLYFVYFTLHGTSGVSNFSIFQILVCTSLKPDIVI